MSVEELKSASPALLIEDAKKTYKNGVNALKGVSLTVEPGEFFGLLGPNGAGKSTLINAMAGLVTLSSGRIAIAGVDVAQEPRQAALNLGVVPQEITFDPFLTVRETLRYQSGYWGVRDNDAWIDEILSALGLVEKADKMVRQLSGGMKRRVLVAQALVHKPPVIVLDEPTAGVDVELREHLWQFIGELHRQGHTIVLTTHYLEEAQSLCRRVAIMKEGEVVACERTDQLLARAAERRLHCRMEKGELPETLRPWLLSAQGPEVTLRAPDAQAVAHILSTFSAAGTVIGGLTVSEAQLEDVFLQLVGNDSSHQRSQATV